MAPKTRSQIRIGISGWTYPPWRGTFYPPGLPHRNELAFASRQLNSIEINGTFYSLQTPRSYQTWYEQTPEDFVFSIKGGRFITHMKRLRDIEIPLANFFASGLLALKEKLGPILWQFPPMMRFEGARFEEFMKLLPRDTSEAARLARRHDAKVSGRALTRTDRSRPLRHAFEIRHDSFAHPEFVSLLKEHGMALVVADTPYWPRLEEMTTDFAYIRLHGAEELYVSGYDDDSLAEWARRIRRWRAGGRRDVFAYFDNDVKARAPFDAMALARILRPRMTDASFPGRSPCPMPTNERPQNRGKFTQNYPTERKNYPGPEHLNQEPLESLIEKRRRKLVRIGSGAYPAGKSRKKAA
jgi:uncharacterized protein YecE (DUF72 family)